MPPRIDLNEVDIEALRAGDEAVLAELLTGLLPRVRGWLWRIIGPGANLDDVVQDCLIELATALPRYRGDAALTTYAHRIAIRVGLRYLRHYRRRNEVSLELVPPIEGGIDPESQAAQREILRRLYRCLDRLSKKRRMAFVLCDIEGLTPSEAAAVNDISAATMRGRLKHARRAMAAMLDREPYLARIGETR